MSRYAVRRGCRFRQVGAIYSVVYPEDLDFALDCFLSCPTQPVDKSILRLADIGVQIVERVDAFGNFLGVWDVWDVIGATYYPSFPSFYEEGMRFGFSRKIRKNAAFSRLTPESRHIFIHEKGYLSDASPLWEERLGIKKCPQGHEHHEDPALFYQNTGFYPEMCTGLLWEAVAEPKKPNLVRQFEDAMPKDLKKGEAITFSYPAAYTPYGFQPAWEPAVTMVLPMSHLEVVKDDLANTHDEAVKILEEGGCGLPYTLENE